MVGFSVRCPRRRSNMPTRASRITVCAVGVSLCFLFLQVAAFGQQPGARFLYGDGTPRFLNFPANFSAEQAASLASTSPLPLWTGSFVYAGTTYSYNMVGTNPAAGSATTTLRVIIVPLRFRFSNGVILDPTTPAFGSSLSAVESTVQSPLFQTSAFAPGGTSVGATQYIDAFQRANFWNDVSTTSPDYHVLLTQPYVSRTLQIDVPASAGTTVAGPGSPIGQVNMYYFNLGLNALIPQLTYVPSSDLLIFLTYNTFFTELGNCCILGFHSAYGSTPATGHTAVVAAYSDPGIFSVPIQDIHALS